MTKGQLALNLVCIAVLGAVLVGSCWLYYREFLLPDPQFQATVFTKLSPACDPYKAAADSGVAPSYVRASNFSGTWDGVQLHLSTPQKVAVSKNLKAVDTPEGRLYPGQMTQEEIWVLTAYYPSDCG